MKTFAQLLAVATLIAGLALVQGCGRKPVDHEGMPLPEMGVPGGQTGGGNQVSGQMEIYVPCGVAGPYGELIDLFKQQNPGIEITQDVANIDVHTKKLVDGKASPDLWISLGDREMEQVKAADRLDGEPVTYAYNSVAMMVANKNPCGIESLQDLTKPEVKTIAMPTETNSSGFYMKAALEKEGVWDEVESKLWLTPEPSQVKAQLSSGKADVGVVYYPCTMETRKIGGKPEPMKGKAQLLGKIPTEISGPIPAQAAVIKGCKNPEAGHAFLNFMLTDEAQTIWENWAFDRAKQPTTGARTTLYLYCGAGIQPFMDKAIAAYTGEHPNIRIDVGYAGSGCLLSQLAFARRGDLYMPGEDFYLNQAKDRGFIAEEKLIGYFDPVLLVQKGNPKGIKTVQDMTRAGLKVGVGEPDAAAVGRATEALLNKAGILQQVEPNIAVKAGNVPELSNMVKLKSLDVAIVWNVTAAQVADDCDQLPIPGDLYEPSKIPLGVLKYSEHAEEAKAFMDFCAGPEGQKMVVEAGMTPATEAGTGA